MTPILSWTLILIIQSSDGITTDKITGFSSKYNCEMAGYTTNKKLEKDNGARWKTIEYSCVQIN